MKSLKTILAVFILSLLIFGYAQIVKADDVAPTINDITSTTVNGTYTTGEVIPIILTFSEAVYTSGDITVQINASSTANCTFSIATSTPVSTASCNYVVATGDDTNALAVSSIAGGVYDVADNPLLNIDSSSLAGIKINTNSPRLISVTSNSADGYYIRNQDINLIIEFSEPIYSASQIIINLNTIPARSCTFLVASSSPISTINCGYTVWINDYTNAPLSVSSLAGNIISANTGNQLVNFKIRDENIDDNSIINVDGILPTISYIDVQSVDVLDGTYGIGASAVLVVTFNEDVKTTATSTIYFDAGFCDMPITSVLSREILCNYSILAGYNSDRLHITSISGNIFDIVGNITSNPNPPNIYLGDSSGSAAHPARNFKIDTLAPTSTLTNVPAVSTTVTSVNATVGGEDVISYKYKLDGGVLSSNTPTSTIISLSNLQVGTHTLYVIGQDTIGNWQDISVNPTTYTWEITNPPATGGGGGGGGGGSVAPTPPDPQVLGVKIFSFSTGRMVKTGNSNAVCHITDDGKRHLYPNSVTFWTWHTGTWSDQNLETISQEEFDNLIAGNNVTVKPDSKLIRFYNSPRIYVVSDGAIINYVTSDIALVLYGKDWQLNVIKIQNGFESDYEKGEPISFTL